MNLEQKLHLDLHLDLLLDQDLGLLLELLLDQDLELLLDQGLELPLRPVPRSHPMPRLVPDVFTVPRPRSPDATFEIHGFDGYEADTEE